MSHGQCKRRAGSGTGTFEMSADSIAPLWQRRRGGRC